MTPVEVGLSIVGSGVSIVLCVYIPILLGTLKAFREEFHKMEVAYASRLARLETMVQAVVNQQKRISNLLEKD